MEIKSESFSQNYLCHQLRLILEVESNVPPLHQCKLKKRLNIYIDVFGESQNKRHDVTMVIVIISRLLTHSHLTEICRTRISRKKTTTSTINEKDQDKYQNVHFIENAVFFDKIKISKQ